VCVTRQLTEEACLQRFQRFQHCKASPKLPVLPTRHRSQNNVGRLLGEIRIIVSDPPAKMRRDSILFALLMTPGTAASCSSDCCSCIKGGGGEACAARCTSCSSVCQTCVKYGGGTGCISDGRCSCGTGPKPPPPPGPGPPGPSDCFSMSSISASQLKCAFPQLSSSKASLYASAVSSKMGRALGNACAWAAFLGNVGTESAGLTEWTQVPCSSATAAPYCGRGPLQITGPSNYKYCAGVGVCGCSTIYSDPEEVSKDVDVGFGTAACVWESLSGHSLSKDADGSKTGLLKTACIINAGHYPCGTPNGWESRQEYWAAGENGHEHYAPRRVALDLTLTHPPRLLASQPTNASVLIR
jgi:predicted chitinase